MPKYKVHSKMGPDKPFRRNGIEFTSTPQEVDSDALKWTPEQLAEFLSKETSTALHIETGGKVHTPEPGTPAEARAAAKAAGVSDPGEAEEEPHKRRR